MSPSLLIIQCCKGTFVHQTCYYVLKWSLKLQSLYVHWNILESTSWKLTQMSLKFLYLVEGFVNFIPFIYRTSMGTQVAKSYSRRSTRTWTILPRNQIFAIKVKTKLKTFPWVSRVPHSKFEANQSRGSWVMIGQINKQTEKQISTLYIYI